MYAASEGRYPTTSINGNTYLIVDTYEKDRYIVKHLLNGNVGDNFKFIEMKDVEYIKYKRVFNRGSNEVLEVFEQLIKSSAVEENLVIYLEEYFIVIDDIDVEGEEVSFSV
ncbi:hypothetical protein [Terribacillus saccharophilus]|uniref:Uncharacterized protein n=1 Tax=Terribacillus saccharophilus TaxID=361277 RepID=A0ABX4GW80_9BACI|nr:hypothetical protein [Terribacillus saccharophilus]PAD34807.1 hypothetical protein CHH56_13580 [Terribacillus saccharophilus]PAD95553.1 hypothetical protein CHH50_13815 [Terribacillus saccharophilus]PAD99132.1 hypothetical protein CHH48_14710 [Terribacillus saccharophilus]